MTVPRTDRVVSEPASAEALREGLISALAMYLGDIDFNRIVGETGRVTATIEIQMNRGHVQWTDGGVLFRRRVNFNG